MESPLHFIRTYNPDVHASTDDWKSLIQCVVFALERFLGASVRIDGALDDAVSNNGFRVDITCMPKIENKIELFIKGFIISIVNDKNKLSIGATLFFYCGGKRLVATTGEAFIDLVYDAEVEVGVWKKVDWFKDLYGEYPEFDNP